MKQIRIKILLLLMLYLSITQTYAQDPLDPAFLAVGVNVGDTFNFEVSAINNQVPFLEIVVDPKNVSANEDTLLPKSFSITVLDIDNDQVNPGYYWIDVVDDEYAIIAYSPRIEVFFESEEYEGNSFLNLHVGGGAITTNNWERVEALFAFQKLNPLLPEWEFDYSLEEDGDLVVINAESAINGLNETIFGYNSQIMNSVMRYNKQTGVLQEEQTTGMRGFANGSSIDVDYHILNTAFNQDENSILPYIAIGFGIIAVTTSAYIVNSYIKKKS